MLVDLRTLKPNPTRDFVVDPMDDECIEKLRDSIKENGFWGGVVCRKTEDGTIQIAGGHTRVAAALAAGVTKAELFVGNGDMDDAAMIRIYAQENATQRGNMGTAQIGSIASTLRFLVKASLLGNISQICDISPRAAECTVGNLTTDKGLGEPLITKFLKGIPGIYEASVKQALANLKASGDYARIITEVQAEIDQENEEARLAQEEAEREQERIRLEREAAEERQRKAEAARKDAEAKAKATKEEAERKRQEEVERRAEDARKKAEAEARDAEERRKKAEVETEKKTAARRAKEGAATTAAKAANAASTQPVKGADGKPTGERKKRDATFDHAGVAKHLKNPFQVASFRDLVTGQGIAPFLPVKNQAALAKRIVELAREREKELTAAFIRENVVTLVLEVKTADRRDKKEAEEKLRREDLLRRFHGLQREFCRSCRGMVTYGLKMQNEIRDWPEGMPIPILNEFRNVIEGAKQVIDTLIERS